MNAGSDVLQEVLGKEAVKIGFPPAKKLGWVTMEKSSSGEQVLMCKVSQVVTAMRALLRSDEWGPGV